MLGNFHDENENKLNTESNQDNAQMDNQAAVNTPTAENQPTQNQQTSAPRSGEETPPQQNQSTYTPPLYQPPQFSGNTQNSFNARQQNGYTYTSYNPAPAPAKKKDKKGLSRGAAVVLCLCTVLLSCAAGFYGAYLATADLESTQNPQTSSKNPSVIYQSSASPANGMSADGGTSSYYNVANLVKNTVVEITTEYVISDRFQYISSGAGSGIIISQDGYILTNNHVIVDDNGKIADTITVRLTDGQEYVATVVGTDSDSDIAVIKIDAGENSLPCAVMGNSDKLAVGEEVIAVGNPLGELGGTVTNGIISALDREVNVDGTLMNLMQTNAAINPGNSGGGLFNMAGELIGVVNAKSSGTGIEGLGFAIPVNDAVGISEQLITQGYVSGKPDLGVTWYDAHSFQQALYYNLPSLGVYVAGLEKGMNDTVFQIRDRIIAMDGKEITSSSDIANYLKSYSVGDTIQFSVYRSGRLIEVTATCYEYNPNIQFEK